eukprot:1066058_1
MVNLRRCFIHPLILCFAKYCRNMSEFLPILKDTLNQCLKIATDKLFAIKALFTTVNLINHPDILPAIGYNKHLETGIQLMIVDFTSMNGEESSNQTDLSAVLGNAKTILRRNNIGLNELNDKYCAICIGFGSHSTGANCETIARNVFYCARRYE